jgi:hypothetical protein
MSIRPRGELARDRLTITTDLLVNEHPEELSRPPPLIGIPPKI